MYGLWMNLQCGMQPLFLCQSVISVWPLNKLAVWEAALILENRWQWLMARDWFHSCHYTCVVAYTTCDYVISHYLSCPLKASNLKYGRFSVVIEPYCYLGGRNPKFLLHENLRKFSMVTTHWDNSFKYIILCFCFFLEIYPIGRGLIFVRW